MSANLLEVKNYLSDYIIKYMGYNPFDYNKYDISNTEEANSLLLTGSCTTTDINVDFTDIKTTTDCDCCKESNNIKSKIP